MEELQGLVAIIQAFFNALKMLFAALTGKPLPEPETETNTAEA